MTDYGKRLGIPYVIVRPGQVYGPGNEGITGRVGIGTFGMFLHLGGSNTIPLTYVDNCAEAIALAGLRKGIDGEVFNIVDDDLPSSRKFLRLYKKNVKAIFDFVRSPHPKLCALLLVGEIFDLVTGAVTSRVQPQKMARLLEKTRYSNEKGKSQVGWEQKIRTEEGLARFFESCRNEERSCLR